MKKTYKNPVLEIVKIQTQQMLAGSPLFSDNPASVDGDNNYNNALGHGDDFDW